jgi:hypothetical protein
MAFSIPLICFWWFSSDFVAISVPSCWTSIVLEQLCGHSCRAATLCCFDCFYGPLNLFHLQFVLGTGCCEWVLSLFWFLVCFHCTWLGIFDLWLLAWRMGYSINDE